MLESSIPLVDLNDYFSTDAERRATFIKVLGDGLSEFGFVAVVGHGIPVELLERAYQLAGQLFALPEGAKKQYETPENGRQRGYTSFGVEHAKDTPIPDLKEFWHIGRTLPADHPLHVSKEVPANLFPAEVPAFEDVFTAFYAQMEGFANNLLSAVGEYMGQPASYFPEMVKDGNTIMRIINYPDMGAVVPAGAVRAAAHEDVNLMTVLPVSTKPGLELMTRDGKWMAVHVPPNVMVCDTGDMIQLHTAGKLRSTTHRVVNPEGSDGGRLSMPFFLHPRPDVVLAHDEAGAPITAKDFLAKRLREIGIG